MIEIPIILGSCMCLFLLRELFKTKNRNQTQPENNLIVFIDQYGRVISMTRNENNIINSIEKINKFTKLELCNSEDEICCITQESIPLGSEVRVLPCNHKFTKDKIDIWLAENNTCPICREVVIKEN
tara:strand:+ start:79 stop:459 length:381 start_codon:yes stop_codon:yes gene_type:complete